MTATAMAGSVHKLPSTKEERKLRKPLIERKRRERINNCLDQLKEAVVGAFHLDQSKLEKADILEMTVKHLQNIQNNKIMEESTEGLEAQQRFSTGYIQCMHEVHNLLLSCEWMDRTLGARLLNHLLKSLPRSSEETCKTSMKSSTSTFTPPEAGKNPISRKGKAPDPTSPRDQSSLKEDKPSEKNPPQSPLPSPVPILQPNLSHNHQPRGLGALDMWRPW
ncbi:transcription cofactor HES-6-like [Ornithorhynchus anatinus]|uniref:Hes family bHLH transcription factor 6 n=1 Tax=Ornithorhynchus anatinus TaxID=9258 RepID=F7FD37_ORNAN|nr:transcription cofactor HES-6-like [Ornithorhynchus anatinus]